jgi:hypothetical protein
VRAENSEAFRLCADNPGHHTVLCLVGAALVGRGRGGVGAY